MYTIRSLTVILININLERRNSMPYHFGVKVLEGKRGLILTQEKYAVVSKSI